jgi:hypothetical protein
MKVANTFSHLEVKSMISADEVWYCSAKAKTDATPIDMHEITQS